MRNGDRTQLKVGGQDAAAADFVKVVILAVNPEHRDRGDVVFSADPAREPDGGERLQQRKQRTTEEPGLLSGHDRHRFGVRQLLRGGECGGARAPRDFSCAPTTAPTSAWAAGRFCRVRIVSAHTAGLDGDPTKKGWRRSYAWQ